MNMAKLVINRVNQPPFEICRGDMVEIYISREHKTIERVTGISLARNVVKCGNLEYEVGRIYPPGTFFPVPETPTPTKRHNLSKILKAVNGKNEPPGGWSENDLVS